MYKNTGILHISEVFAPFPGLPAVQHERHSNEILLGGNPLLASDVLLAWQAMRQSASAIHYFPPEKCNLSTHTRTCVGGFCDANYMNTEGVNLIRRTESDESGFLHGTISRLIFNAEVYGVCSFQ